MSAGKINLRGLGRERVGGTQNRAGRDRPWPILQSASSLGCRE